MAQAASASEKSSNRPPKSGEVKEKTSSRGSKQREGKSKRGKEDPDETPKSGKDGGWGEIPPTQDDEGWGEAPLPAEGGKARRSTGGSAGSSRFPHGEGWGEPSPQKEGGKARRGRKDSTEAPRHKRGEGWGDLAPSQGDEGWGDAPAQEDEGWGDAPSQILRTEAPVAAEEEGEEAAARKPRGERRQRSDRAKEVCPLWFEPLRLPLPETRKTP